MPDDTDDVTTPGPEEHWTHADPQGQPARDAVLGAGRLVQETRTRLGLDKTPDEVAADLRSRGHDLGVDRVAQLWDSPG